ncbi:oxidoreductase [Pseudomonas sp. PB101]|uniref:PDR/VanB family oxidoreductase n=1 Tax=Pseudomonas sp. PB101 TaxID=2495428 RepID=UPI0013651BBF|nr:PDR/VanB family oxidoreductase [Pseudomonas sp. PB101]MVW84807.1 oxidoreductase [Pseudomonas sp. PB101]
MLDVIIHEKTDEAEGIVSLVFQAQNGTQLPAYSAGSHLDVHLPNGTVRQYSLFKPLSKETANTYQIGVLLSPTSRGGSRCIHEQLQVGDSLRISEPRNLFPLTHEAQHSVFFAGGIGITPIMCMAERLAEMGSTLELHYCSRSFNSAAFIPRLTKTLPKGSLNVYFDDKPANPFKVREILQSLPPQTHLYVCGPSGFMEHVLSNAKALSWPDNLLHREYFNGTQDTQKDGAFELKIASTGQLISVPAGKTAAQSLIEAGVNVPLSCEQGVCGTCLVRVLEGEPDHQDMFLSEAERARNDQFTPCCSRAKTSTLVLDL